jgi:hypothetical protein
VGLAAVHRVKIRQISRLTWIKARDANSKLFHLQVSARRRKNHIPSIQHEEQVFTTHQAKAELLRVFFAEHLGTPAHRDCTLNWPALQPRRHDFSDLDRDILEAKIYVAVKDTPAEKSPGLDGYIGAFYKLCWDTIKEDLIAALREFFQLRVGCWNLLNSA